MSNQRDNLFSRSAVFAFIMMSLVALPGRAEIINLVAFLNTAQETISGAVIDTGNTPTNAFGSAEMTYDTDTRLFSWNITFSNLSSPVSVGHFHGPNDINGTAAPVFAIASANATSPITGSRTLDDTEEGQLLEEMWYINIHTQVNGGGELRGQVFNVANTISLNATLDTAQEIPPPTPVAGLGNGNAVMLLNPINGLFSWNVNFADLTSNIVAAHFHGPAPAGQTAPPVITIAGTDAPAPIVGSFVLSEAQMSELLANLWYINIHTTLNQSGEIRGQVVTEFIYNDHFE